MQRSEKNTTVWDQLSGEAQKQHAAESKTHIQRFLSPKSICMIAVVLLLLLLVIFPYTKVFILSSIHADEFMDVTYDGGYEPAEMKVYKYKPGKSAECLVLLDDGMYCVKAEYEWDSSLNEWHYVTNTCVWTLYGGNAQEFCWPMFYWKEFWLCKS